MSSIKELYHRVINTQQIKALLWKDYLVRCRQPVSKLTHPYDIYVEDECKQKLLTMVNKLYNITHAQATLLYIFICICLHNKIRFYVNI